MTLPAGARIGKYVVDRELGHGGFGIIYVARDTGLDRDVALKVLRSEHVARRDLVQRFLQEARAAAKIDHPGIVTVFECGVVDDSRSEHAGTVYIAMELLRGETLAVRLKRGRLPLAMALGLCQQAASALAAAHAANIVHRDLKPDNLFLCPDRAVLGGERVKLLDFGVAKLAEGSWQSEIKTHSMTLLGTPRYMSPEQCKSSAKVDARSDIYTLGCIIFELVCGRPPYDGDSGELIAMHQLAPVPVPRQLAPDLPPALDALLRAMLAKSPEDRPQNMEQVEAQLESSTLHGDDAPTQLLLAAPPPQQPSPRTARELQMSGTLVDASTAQRRSQRGIVIGALVALAVGSFVAVVVSGGGSHGATPPPPPPVANDAAVAPAPIAVPTTPPQPPPPPVAIDAGVVDPTPPPPPPPPTDAPTPAPKPTDPPPSAAAPCDAEAFKTAGRNAETNSAHAAALAEFEKALKCKPDTYGYALAYMSACKALNVPKARAYFAHLPPSGAFSQPTLETVCIREGIDPKM